MGYILLIKSYLLEKIVIQIYHFIIYGQIKFITPDFRTIVRGRKKGKEVLLKMDSLDSKNSWLRKVHTS